MKVVRAVLGKISAILARASGVIVVLLCIGLVVSLLTSVFFRYIIGQALSWPEEISLILFTWLVLLAGSLGVHEKFHVRLTIVTGRLPRSLRMILERLTTAAIGAFGIIMIYSGFDLVQRTAEHLTPTLRLSLDWLNYAAPVCGALICLHALAELVKPGKDIIKP